VRIGNDLDVWGRGRRIHLQLQDGTGNMFLFLHRSLDVRQLLQNAVHLLNACEGHLKHYMKFISCDFIEY